MICFRKGFYALQLVAAIVIVGAELGDRQSASGSFVLNQRSFSKGILGYDGVRVDDLNIPIASKSILEQALDDAMILSRKTSLQMDYGLFRGVSTLRSLSTEDQKLLDPSHYGIESLQTVQQKASFYRMVALLLLLRENLGAAHEILLGVTVSELKVAEHAATHPGQTPWAENHPASSEDTSDWIHSVIHRYEGANTGEGNHTGYFNAMYWAKGGPKKLKEPAKLLLREILATMVSKKAPILCKSVLRSVQTDIDGDDTTNKLAWDDLAFIQQCRLYHEGKLSKQESLEVEELQRMELCALLHHEVSIAMGQSGISESLDKNG